MRNLALLFVVSCFVIDFAGKVLEFCLKIMSNLTGFICFFQVCDFKCYSCKSINDKKCIDKPKDTNKVACLNSKLCAKLTINGE